LILGDFLAGFDWQRSLGGLPAATASFWTLPFDDFGHSRVNDTPGPRSRILSHISTAGLFSALLTPHRSLTASAFWCDGVSVRDQLCRQLALFFL